MERNKWFSLLSFSVYLRVFSLICLCICFFFCILTGFQERSRSTFAMWVPNQYLLHCSDRYYTKPLSSRNILCLPGEIYFIYCDFSRGNYFDTYLLFHYAWKISTWIFQEALNRNWRIRQVKVDRKTVVSLFLNKYG